MTSLTLKSITKTWGDLTAVQPTDIHVADGEFLVLLGPSGCGKTTLMRIISGLETATSGVVLKDGEEITDVLPKDRNMAMVFQGYALYPHMTVLENIAYPLRAKGMGKIERNRLAQETAEKVEMTDFLNQLPKNLSGGQRQRVAIARALVRQPDVFLMDEPLSNLDARLRGNMRSKIKHLQRETGITTIYVTHDQVEAMTLADRVVVLKAGEIQQIGTPEDIYDNPSNIFVAGFLGSPPMNFIDGKISKGTFVTGKNKISAGKMSDCPSVKLGVRAEDIKVVPPKSAHMTGTVYSVEPMGDNTLLVVSYEETLLSVKADKKTKLDVGSKVGMKFNESALHFFNTVDGKNLKD